jgi:predicted nucleic acid-binding protein
MADEKPKQPPPHYYWDSCVFIAALNEERAAYGDIVDDMKQFLAEAKAGDCIIHCSTITIAEITKNRLKSGAHSDFSSFLRDFRSAVVPVSPDPNIMALAAELRGLTYTKTGGSRTLATPDAIHLASAIALVESYGIPSLTAFHTFDDGKAKGPNGKSVPLLSFETWCEACDKDPIAQKVIKMKRAKPLHPAKKLSGI